MGFFRRLFGREAKTGSSLELFREIYGGGRMSRAGPVVNVQTALEVPVILSICRVLCDGVSQVPYKVFQKDGVSRRVAEEHPLHERLDVQANEWQTSFEFRETIMLHLILCTNAYVFVNRVGVAREIREMLPIEPHRVSVKRLDSGALEYTVTAESGRVATFGADAIWHLRGPSWNGWMGMDAIKLARNAIGLAISLEQGQADFQKNGAKVSGAYSVPEKLSPEKYAQLRAYFDVELAKTSAWRPLILDQDAKWYPHTMSGVDQQLLETRKHQVEDICRMFRVMPIMVGQADKAATYASAEQMFLNHVVHTLSPWYRRIEQSADVNLLSEADRKAGYYTRFVPNALMRGAAKDRAEFYAKALGSGGSAAWMTPNEVRGLEELDWKEGGDELAKPSAAAAPPQPPTDNNEGA